MAALLGHVDVAEQSALFELASAGGLRPAGAPSDSSSPAALAAAADGLRLYLDYVGALLDPLSRARLQLVFREALGVAAPQAEALWLRVEPSLVPPKLQALRERMARYGASRQALTMALDGWRAAQQEYRRTRRRVRSLRQEVYSTRRTVRIEWR